MSGRDEIFAAIGAALGPEERPPVGVDRGYRRVPAPAADAPAPDVFAERVADYRATVVRCAAADVADTVASQLSGDWRVIVPEGLSVAVPAASVDAGQSAAELDEFDAVVTDARLGVAETGTIVLDHGPGQGRRALSLVPDAHVCIVRERQVVPGVVEAVEALDPLHPQTWISGPSATSDIELDRVEGVHGPRTLVVVLAAD